MAPAGTRTFARIAAGLALAYGLALSAPYFYTAIAAVDGPTLGGALIALTWTALPAYVAAAFVSASPTRSGAAFFLAFEVALIASFGWKFAHVLDSSTGGFIFFGWPLLQLGALVMAFLLALAFGWRMRPDFLKD